MSSPTYRLETLGTVVLKGSGLAIRAADQRQQRRRLALLAALASAGDRGMSRDQLLLLFWPDSTQKKARHSLDQLLYALRTSLGESIFLGTNPIRLNPESITADVSDFNRNVAEGELETAVEIYSGAFLDGFYLSETREFEEWVESERRRLAQSYESVLERLATDAERDGETARVIHWRRRLTETNPVSTRHAVALMTALASSGDPGAAIAFGERFEQDTAELVGPTATAGVRQLLVALRELPAKPVELPTIPHRGDDSETKTVSRKSRTGIYIALTAIAAMGLSAAIFSNTRPDVSDEMSVARGTSNLAAYDYYLRGNEAVVMRNDSSARAALGYFQQATEIDSAFAQAHAGLSRAYARLAMSSAPDIPRDDLKERALRAARKAIALNDSLAAGHSSLGLINAYWLIDVKVAREHLERAVALDPSDPGAREFLSTVYIYLGRPADALRQMQEAVRNNPLSPTSRAMLAAIHYIVGRCDLAIPALDSLAEMKPPLLRVPVARSLCYASEGDWPAAASAVRDLADAGVIRAVGLRGMSLARSGNRTEAMAARDRLRGIAASNPAAWFDASIVSWGLGDTASTYSELQRSVDAGLLPWELFGPPFDGLRRNPQFVRMAAAKGVRAIP